MNAEQNRVCRTCGAPLPSETEFCPVCAFRVALKSEQAAPESVINPIPELRFGHYEILTHEDGTPFELGRGAMGITYKAFDVDLRRMATLKVISPRYLADESIQLRFLREARAAAKVRHPNVASVFHLGTIRANYFYAMEFVEGETLGSLIKRSGRLEVKFALEIFKQVAAGLSAIHNENLVHRDIKPSNIMVSLGADGVASVKIIDLGLAKTLAESESQANISLSGAFAGTPEFASPEQFTGIDVDIRSDLYSLGVTLWEMLAGQPPFRGSPNEVMHQHQHGSLPLEKLREVPQPAIALLEVILRKDRARRFQSPAELLATIPIVRDALEAGRPVMKTIRVFISSSGDVQTERNLANRLVRSIAAEFDLPVCDSDSNFQRLADAEGLPQNSDGEGGREQEHKELLLCPHFRDYQWQGDDRWIPQVRQFDLMVCILWGRLGPPVSPALRLPGGGIPTSGTAYEIAWAEEHASRNNGIPILRVYRNASHPVFPLEPREEREAFVRQWDSVQDFFAEWEQKENGLASFSKYRTLAEFEEQFRRQFRDFLADQIRHDIGSQASNKKVRRWKSSPFRGLNVFDFEHAPIFYGRTRAVGEVLGAMEQQRRAQQPFVLVVGASGSGKSSLVRAGVLPLLTQPGTIEGVGIWRRAITRPGAGGSGGDCFDALASSLLEPAGLPGLGNPESTSVIRDLAAELRDHSEAVALRVRDALDNAAREWKIQWARDLRGKGQKPWRSDLSGEAKSAGQQREEPELPKARMALVVDQLEELFTSGFSPGIRQKYVSTIAGLVQSGRVFILSALRSDFYSSYQEFPELIELTRPGGKVDLRPPTAYEIGSMIRLPAEAAGLNFELDPTTGQRLDEGLRDAASTTPESLPLLEHVLSLLYEKQVDRGDDLLRWSDYRDLGELKGALAKYAEAVFATLRPSEQAAFPNVMRHLVTLGQIEDEPPNRRTVPYRHFLAGGGADEKSSAKAFIDLFIEKRLLVADTDPQGEVTVSVAHEALLREWQRIKEWLTDNRDFLRMRGRLDSSFNLWLSRGKQKDDLLGPGLPLAEGEKLIQDFAASLSQGETDYVQASIAEHKLRQRTRERIRFAVMAGITAALVVAVIFGGVSYRQSKRARRAKVLADRAANRATLAGNEAQKLINFMTIDLRDKLKPIGRLDLLDDVNLRVRAYYDQLAGINDSPEILLERSVAMVNYGDIRQDRGDLPGALESYQSALAMQKQLVKEDTTNVQRQRDLATCFENMGDVLKLQGNIPGALESYRESLPIRQGLANQNPTNAAAQLDLSVSLERIGDVLNGQGDVEAALDNYEKSLPIREKLVAKDPDRPALQLGLSRSYADIGDMLGLQGNWDDALRRYRSALLIRQKLADNDPGDAELKYDLSSCLIQTGYALILRNDLEEALDVYLHSLVITEALAAKDPTNTGWKRNLSISLERVGDVLKAHGKYSDALKIYQDSLSIRQELAGRDTTNSVWQSDVSWSEQEIGDVLLAQKKYQEALQIYQKSLAIARELTKADPTNEEWQSNLETICQKTGEAFVAQEKYSEALQLFQESLAICDKLTKTEARNADRAADDASALAEVGMTLARIDPASDLQPRAMLTRARDILLNLKQRSTLSVPNQNRLDQIQAALANL
jgi:serine/threonine protein kinase/tetratricopeptide (TPR) repeat protein